MSTSVTAVRAISAEEFVERYDKEPVELDQGQVVETSMPTFQHGIVCANMAYHLDDFVRKNELGRVATNDSWIKTRRSPDSVRGTDVLFISYQRLPQGPVPTGLIKPTPELVVEVRSPSDSWTMLQDKSTEYLDAGVQIVLILDPDQATATLYRADELPQTFHNGDAITIPDLLPGFSVTLAKVFG